MTTRNLMLKRAAEDMYKFGRKGERQAFVEGLACGEGADALGIRYKRGGRCFYAFGSGYAWGEAIKREDARDAEMMRSAQACIRDDSRYRVMLDC